MYLKNNVIVIVNVAYWRTAVVTRLCNHDMKSLLSLPFIKEKNKVFGCLDMNLWFMYYGSFWFHSKYRMYIKEWQRDGTIDAHTYLS